MAPLLLFARYDTPIGRWGRCIRVPPRARPRPRVDITSISLESAVLATGVHRTGGRAAGPEWRVRVCAHHGDEGAISELGRASLRLCPKGPWIVIAGIANRGASISHSIAAEASRIAIRSPSSATTARRDRSTDSPRSDRRFQVPVPPAAPPFSALPSRPIRWPPDTVRLVAARNGAPIQMSSTPRQARLRRVQRRKAEHLPRRSFSPSTLNRRAGLAALRLRTLHTRPSHASPRVKVHTPGGNARPPAPPAAARPLGQREPDLRRPLQVLYQEALAIARRISLSLWTAAVCSMSEPTSFDFDFAGTRLAVLATCSRPRPLPPCRTTCRTVEPFQQCTRPPTQRRSAEAVYLSSGRAYAQGAGGPKPP